MVSPGMVLGTRPVIAPRGAEALPKEQRDAEGDARRFSSLSIVTVDPFVVCVHEGSGEASLVKMGASGGSRRWFAIGDGEEAQVDGDGQIIRRRTALTDEEKRVRAKVANDSRARSRLRRYFKKNGLGKMWTLTNAEPCFDRALMHQRVNEFVQRWRHAFNDEAFPYAYVLELHPQGHGLHVHFATRPGFVSWSQIGALWGHGFVQYSDNKRYAGEGGRERSRRLANYLCKYLDKSVGDNDRDEGEHRYEVGQGFDPVKVRRDFKTEKEARDWLAAYVGEKFEEVWCSDDREEWDGRPTWLFFSG